jgi:hypothetical protein
MLLLVNLVVLLGLARYKHRRPIQYINWCVANLRVGVASISSFSVAAMLGAIILVIVLTELAFVQAVPTT